MKQYLFNINLTNSTDSDHSWYLDTGARHYMTYNKVLLTYYSLELLTPLDVHLGDDSTKQAKGLEIPTFNLLNNKHPKYTKHTWYQDSEGTSLWYRVITVKMTEHNVAKKPFIMII